MRKMISITTLTKTQRKYIGLGMLLSLMVSAASIAIYLQYFDGTGVDAPDRQAFTWNFEDGLVLSSQISERSSDLLEVRFTHGRYIDTDLGWGLINNDPALFLNLTGQEIGYNNLFVLRRYDQATANSYTRFNRWTPDAGINEHTGYISNNSLQPLHTALVSDLEEATSFDKVWDRQIEAQNVSFNDVKLYPRISDGSLALVIEHRYNEGSLLEFTIFSDPTQQFVMLELEYSHYENLEIEWNEHGEPGAYGSDIVQESVEVYHGNFTQFMPDYLRVFPQVLDDIYTNEI